VDKLQWSLVTILPVALLAVWGEPVRSSELPPAKAKESLEAEVAIKPSDGLAATVVSDEISENGRGKPNSTQTIPEERDRSIPAKPQLNPVTPTDNRAEVDEIDRPASALQAPVGETLPFPSEQLQEDVNAVYATGFFGRVEPLAEETPLGVRVIFEVLPNPTLNRVVAQNNQALTQAEIDEIFGNQYGQILNLRDFQRGVDLVNQWYQDNGYVLAQVIDPPPIPDEGHR